MCRYFMLMLVICAVAAQSTRTYETTVRNEVVQQLEEACSSRGGLCVRAAECPAGLASRDGYCPLQRNRGVICCHSVPTSERNCHARGGECMRSCSPRMLIKEPTECAGAEPHCCLLL